MRIFLVRYGEKLVGVLYIDEGGKYKYTCNQDIIDEIPKTEPLAPALSINQKEFGFVIPFFKVRIDSIDGPIKNREYGFVNDKVRLVEV